MTAHILSTLYRSLSALSHLSISVHLPPSLLTLHPSPAPPPPSPPPLPPLLSLPWYHVNISSKSLAIIHFFSVIYSLWWILWWRFIDLWWTQVFVNEVIWKLFLDGFCWWKVAILMLLSVSLSLLIFLSWKSLFNLSLYSYSYPYYGYWHAHIIDINLTVAFSIYILYNIDVVIMIINTLSKFKAKNGDTVIINIITEYTLVMMRE